jgi:hypothetical protein
MGLYALRNKGGGDGPGSWVWDALRIRGTVSGHQKDYELVGIMGNYVPRKATVRPPCGGRSSSIGSIPWLWKEKTVRCG